MLTTQQLREQRANIWDTMQEIHGRAVNGVLSAEDAQSYDRAESELDSIEAQIARAERHESRSSMYESVDRSGVVPAADDSGTEDQYERAFRAFLRDGTQDMTREDREVLRAGWVDGKNFRNAAGVGIPSGGGYAVPQGFREVFVETLKYYGPMLDLAERIDTETGAPLPWPTSDDTGNVGALLAENTAVTEQDVTLGQAQLDAYMYTSKLVRVSFQLLQDRPDFDTWLARKLGERIGRILNQHFTVGTGTAQPDGIVTSATVGVTGTGSFATTGGIGYANLVDVVESLDPAYGTGAGLRWMMHQSARKAIRKLLDAQNRPIWEPSVQAGQPDSLLGYPVSINNDMPALAVSSKSLLFGNIAEAYVVRVVQDLATLRLTERYADFLQVGFLAFERADGTLQNGAAVRVFQTTATV